MTKCEELKRFQSAYNFRSPEMFAKSRYKTIKNSLNEVRLPENLPLTSDIQKLRSFALKELEAIVAMFP